MCVECGSPQQDFPPFSGEECVNKNLNCVRAERAVVYSYALPSKFVRAERRLFDGVYCRAATGIPFIFLIAILIVLELKVKVASTPLEF